MKRFFGLCSLAGVVVLMAGCALFPPPVPEHPLAFYDEANPADESQLHRYVTMRETGLRVLINTFPQLTERDLISAKLKDTTYGPSIELEFDDHGRMALDRMTAERDSRLVVFVDDRPIMAWYVKKRITDGKFVLFGDFSEEHAQSYLKAWDKQIRKNLAP